MVEIKEKITRHFKTKWYAWIIILFFIGFVFGWFQVKKIPFKIDKDSLFWFFSATSQSMAALFAVVGMFGVFRYQIVSEKVRKLYETLKLQIVSPAGMRLFGDRGVIGWLESEIISNANKLLDEKKRGKQALPEYEKIFERMEKTIQRIKKNLIDRDTTLSVTKLSLFFMLVTFLISIGCLPFSGEFENNVFGKFILYVLITLIVVSMGIAFYSIRFSIPPRKKIRKKSFS